MTATVYVPLDGSERAEAALLPATALAARAGADLVLFATPWPNTSTETVSSYLSVRAGFLDRPARTRLVLDREPADAIRMVAAEPDALVCMTTHGRGALRKALLGSVAEEIVRTSVAPALFVGPGMRAEWELGKDPLVIAGLDGSTSSLAAAQAAGELAASIRARVRAVEVLRPSDVITVGEFPGGDVALLEAAVAEIEQRGVAADYEVVDGYDAADTLSKQAATDHAAVIAVASHGRSGLARAVLGSVAMRTIRHAPCPVLVAGPSVHRHATDGATVSSQEPSSP
jgi:nucleotide-binding universal stress UspA family protein